MLRRAGICGRERRERMMTTMTKTANPRAVTLSSGEERRRINMLWPVSLHTRLRRFAADRDLDVTSAATCAVDEVLRRKGY